MNDKWKNNESELIEEIIKIIDERDKSHPFLNRNQNDERYELLLLMIKDMIENG